MSSFPTLNTDSSNKTKSFWERPEGTTGMVTLGLLGLGGFFLINALLPTLLTFFTLGVAVVGKAIVLTVLCLILAGIFYIITNKKVQTLVKYFFKSAMRQVTGAFVEIDPIGIMKSYISDLKDRLGTMDDRIGKLRGQIRYCQEQITQNEREHNKALNMAKAAREAQKNNVFTLNARIAGRLEQSNLTLQQLLAKMEILYRALVKYREAADVVIQDMESEIKVRKQERDMILASHSAMTAAAAIMRGDGDAKELFDQAMEYTAEDYGRKLGEIENFMDSSRSFIDGLDLQNSVYDANALKQLEAWEQRADSLLLGDTKRQLLEAVSIQQPATQGVTIEGEYNKFFK